MRPSAFTPAAVSFPPPPKVSQFDQPPDGDSCQRCWKVLPFTANTSRRPSAFGAMASSAPPPGPPSGSQADQLPFTSCCQAWCTPSAPAANTSRRPSADRADTTRPDSAGCTGGLGRGPLPGVQGSTTPRSARWASGSMP